MELFPKSHHLCFCARTLQFDPSLDLSVGIPCYRENKYPVLELQAKKVRWGTFLFPVKPT